MFVAIAIVLLTVTPQAYANRPMQSTSDFTTFVPALKQNRMIHIESIKQVKTRRLCAMLCVQHPTCKVFIYHQSTRRCDMGSGRKFHASNSPDDIFMVPFKPDDFMRIPDATYADAINDCQDRGMRMMTMKTLDKLEYLLKLTPSRIWLGVNDEAVEGQWRWLDDGTIIDPDFKDIMFCPGEPAAVNDADDCGVRRMTKWECPLARDLSCTSILTAWCEVAEDYVL